MASTRQRQSQRIMREKIARKKRKIIMRRVMIIGGACVSVVIIGSGLWAWKSGAAMRAVQAVENGAFGLTAKAGFSLQSLYLEGRNRTSMEEVDKALGVKKGDPILQVSINDVKARLEKIESVKFATVERALPGTLYVKIVEREPVAQWQHQGKIALVDDNGNIMNGLDMAPYRKLPLIIGDEAPKHVAELMQMLAAQPELEKRFAAAFWVGERRWNIRLDKNIEVKLPEQNPADAWKKLAEIETRQKVLERDITEVDLRLEGKMFIRLAPDQMDGKKPKSANSKSA